MSMARAQSRAWAATALALGVALTLGACGSKTGLLVPEIASDAMDAWIPPEACVPGRFPLERRSAAMMFLFDRSTSMNLGLDGMESRPTRWEAMRVGLAATLPIYQDILEMGAVFFPQSGSAGNIMQLCQTASAVDVMVGPRRASAILSVFASTAPLGGTPTFDAIRLAQRYLAGLATRGRARYIVLATDGGPNCNPALDRATCTCTSQTTGGVPNCSTITTGNYNCLDDRRTLGVIRETYAMGIPTFVIGIDDPSRPDLTAVLDQMALEGGRANSDGTGRRYYSARRVIELQGAFERIQNTIVRCAYVTPSRPESPEAITVQVDGQPIARDGTRREGWDWTDPAFGEITFFGAICSRIVSANPRVEATVACGDGG